MKLGIVDYGRGNLRSVQNAVRSLGSEPHLVRTPGEISGLTHLIFPGQGAFGDCMKSLRDQDLVHPLQDWIAADKPFFGICVGFQLLFEGSEEAPETPGLGIFSGQCQKLTPQPDSTEQKVPHMGWNSLEIRDPSDPAWSGLSEEPFTYFVHSYCPKEHHGRPVAATCNYGGETFCAAVRQRNLFATQFHPEKSQHAGLRLLGNFL